MLLRSAKTRPPQHTPAEGTSQVASARRSQEPLADHSTTQLDVLVLLASLPTTSVHKSFQITHSAVNAESVVLENCDHIFIMLLGVLARNMVLGTYADKEKPAKNPPADNISFVKLLT